MGLDCRWGQQKGKGSRADKHKMFQSVEEPHISVQATLPEARPKTYHFCIMHHLPDDDFVTEKISGIARGRQASRDMSDICADHRRRIIPAVLAPPYASRCQWLCGLICEGAKLSCPTKAAGVPSWSTTCSPRTNRHPLRSGSG